jgi:hypothetical protein
MTAPLPPTSGPAGDGSEQSKLSYPQGGLAGNIEADHPDLSGVAAQSVANAEAWQEGIAPMLDSGAGYGMDGITIAPAVAAGDSADEWDSSVSFPHAGP